LGIIMNKVLKAITVLLVVASVAFAAGCTGKTGNTGNETQGNADQLEPVNPEIPTNMTEKNTAQANKTMEAGPIVTEAENGKTISLRHGGSFTLELREDPSAGYAWELYLSSGLSILDERYVEGPNPQNLVGVPGTHSWLIEAVDKGSQNITGIYRRSWENTTSTAENFTLNVEVF
jgi:inhibitor of cysteine peptidase